MRQQATSTAAATGVCRLAGATAAVGGIARRQKICFYILMACTVADSEQDRNPLAMQRSCRLINPLLVGGGGRLSPTVSPGIDPAISLTLLAKMKPHWKRWSWSGIFVRCPGWFTASLVTRHSTPG
jgi:hypothetical protein